MHRPIHLSLCLALVALAPLAAQTTATGAISGVITDDHGAPLAGATVTLISDQVTRTTTTGADGSFRLGLLNPGVWQIRISKDGFQTATTAATVAANQPLKLDFKLAAVGSACVVITTTVPSVDLTSTTTGMNYSMEPLASVPKGRSFSNLASFAPGVSGASAAENSYVVDGLTTTDYRMGFQGASLIGDATPQVRPPSAPGNTEAYDRIVDNPFRTAGLEPLSTFSIDVDTAAYSNVRRFLQEGQLPPKDAIRIEELLNSFRYDYPEPKDREPFSVSTEYGACPWNTQHRLLRIGLQGRHMDATALPARNLVFLIDVSGSMDEENRLPLVVKGLQALTRQLRKQDSVAIVVYAGNSGLVLPPTSGADKDTILATLGRLSAGGSTNGADGIQLAYKVAKEHFQKGADNRVILCTDGDFNVGVSDRGSLVRLIEEERKSGVFLTCLGFGMGNYKDATIQDLADKGNGHHAYIDSLAEMDKVFGEGGMSLVTIAKDVKVQVEFNPARVQAYRLLGYENRLLAKEDFKDDAKDAGEINAGHSVTALYEIVPPGAPLQAPSMDALKYQRPARLNRAAASRELLTLKLRYKAPDGERSRESEFPVEDAPLPAGKLSLDTRWAEAVAAFSLALRDSPHRGTASLQLAKTLALGAEGQDRLGYRAEFLRLLDTALRLQKQGLSQEPLPGSR